jgi:hypothetical protein
MATKKWKRMAEIYQIFAHDKHLEFTEQRLEDCFSYETFGKEIPDPLHNGYLQGKRNMDITVEMWINDIRSGHLTKWELYQEFPKWFIDKVIPADVLLEDKQARIEMIKGIMCGK